MDATENQQTPWMHNVVRVVLSGCLIAFSPQILAQEDEGAEAAEEEEATTIEVEEVAPTAEDDEPMADELVVVTGSRLKRDTYSSIAPLQIITAETSREAGLIDAGDILRESSATSGNQVDLTFQGYVLDDGPGQTEVSLRGLGGARTLILVNGRRIAPSGVEGAPSSPDAGLIPGSLVVQYDLLLDGASSVYGSDAIGGVANVILRNDFDGFEFNLFPTMPAHDNGFRPLASMTWGKNFDRGFIGIAGEWSDQEAVTLDDRPWTAGCERNAEIDQSGQRRHQDLYYSNVFNMDWDDCTFGTPVGIFVVPGTRYTFLFHTPGYSNGGWGNFSESSLFRVRGVDGNGDGKADVNFRKYNGLNGKEQFAHLFPERSQASVMAYGEYTLEGDMNLTPFFEVLYVQREFHSNSGGGQFIADVPARNPYNLCNPEAENGIDCGLAWNALLNNPNVAAQFAAIYGGSPAALFPFLYSPPLGPVPTEIWLSVRGDRNLIYVDQDQLRLVGGAHGDLPWLDFANFSDWTFDFAVAHTQSTGTSRRPGIRQDRINLALGNYSSTDTPCENDSGEPLAADAAPGCVPVNIFAPSLLPSGLIGDFATAAERNYIIDDRDFDTVYTQTLVSYYMTGNVLKLPADWIVGGIGFEYRLDDIESIPDTVASEGLLYGFFKDGGAVGDKYTRELFGELEFPLIAGQPAAEELVFNVSARWTDDEFYGGAWTHSYKMAYRPINSLLLRATTGTSYRAPNLRELFLVPQTGFLRAFDPCLIPRDAIDQITGEYLPEEDRRDRLVLDNCRANGVDPTVASNNGLNTYSIEVGAGGIQGLDEERSESLSAGFSFEQPFTNAFDLSMGMNYYEIEVTDSIIEPSLAYIIFDCYYSPSGVSSFCDRIQREPNPQRPLIDYVDRSFINRDSEIHRGVDLNVAFEDSWTVFDRAIDVTADLIMHRQIEASDLFVNDQGIEDFDDDAREWGYNELTGQLNLAAEYGKWRFRWTTLYLGSVHQDPDGVDEWSEALTLSDTCLGPPDDLLCRDVGFADEYFHHSIYMRWRGDSLQIAGGIRNVFDEPPPVVDGTEVLSVNNSPIGYGYDLFGKRYFLNIRYLLGGPGGM